MRSIPAGGWPAARWPACAAPEDDDAARLGRTHSRYPRSRRVHGVRAVTPLKIGSAFTRAAGVLTERGRPAGPPAATTLPSGAVCFLFTDIEGSTRLWEHHPEPMAAALARHDALLRDCVVLHGGVVAKTVGDGLLAAFPTAQGAVTAALDGQFRLAAERWGNWGLPGPLRV